MIGSPSEIRVNPDVTYAVGTPATPARARFMSTTRPGSGDRQALDDRLLTPKIIEFALKTRIDAAVGFTMWLAPKPSQARRVERNWRPGGAAESTAL